MKRRGFTLIEVLVVLVIIGIMLGITIPSFERYQARTRLVGDFARLTGMLDEAFSASRSEPLYFDFIFEKGSTSFTYCESDGSELKVDPSICRNTVVNQVFSPEVEIAGIVGAWKLESAGGDLKDLETWDETNWDNGTQTTDNPIMIRFEPPYGDVKFYEDLNGDGDFEDPTEERITSDAYYVVGLKNPSPLFGYVTIWGSSLIESHLD